MGCLLCVGQRGSVLPHHFYVLHPGQWADGVWPRYTAITMRVSASPSSRRLFCAFLLAGAFVAVSLSVARLPRRYAQLDARLGAAAWQPTKLLETLALEDETHGDLPYQALRRLLDLQQPHFHHPAPPHNCGGTGTADTFAHVKQRTKTRIIVIGTGTLQGCYTDTDREETPYWHMEKFTFSTTGELLKREAYSNTEDCSCSASNG